MPVGRCQDVRCPFGFPSVVSIFLALVDSLPSVLLYKVERPVRMRRVSDQEDETVV